LRMRSSVEPATPPLSITAAASDTKRTEAAAEPKYKRTSGRSDLDTPCNQNISRARDLFTLNWPISAYFHLLG
jgi:hypothetical protein